MPRACFTFRVLADAVEEYRRRHAEVWPEMQQALSGAGWHNFSLFLAPDGTVVGYVEVDNDLASALEAMQQQAVNRRWQEQMAPLVDTQGRPADQSFLELDEIFHLP